MSNSKVDFRRLQQNREDIGNLLTVLVKVFAPAVGRSIRVGHAGTEMSQNFISGPRLCLAHPLRWRYLRTHLSMEGRTKQ